MKNYFYTEQITDLGGYSGCFKLFLSERLKFSAKNLLLAK